MNIFAFEIAGMMKIGWIYIKQNGKIWANYAEQTTLKFKKETIEKKGFGWNVFTPLHLESCDIWKSSYSRESISGRQNEVYMKTF